ncbi:hypothetical protein OSB04_023226 [Centaurea solstitialis]|uniref:Uncharacterized protein n=1 Tax=Centaurea solstitialis TaxID=347529 RepID=A0AA38SKF0_9ASTR|nr:hypothetical protein OSB04_023226 [Centaurea solstitialis]
MVIIILVKKPLELTKSKYLKLKPWLKLQREIPTTSRTPPLKSVGVISHNTPKRKTLQPLASETNNGKTDIKVPTTISSIVEKASTLAEIGA